MEIKIGNFAMFYNEVVQILDMNENTYQVIGDKTNKWLSDEESRLGICQIEECVEEISRELVNALSMIPFISNEMRIKNTRYLQSLIEEDNHKKKIEKQREMVKDLVLHIKEMDEKIKPYYKTELTVQEDCGKESVYYTMIGNYEEHTMIIMPSESRKALGIEAYTGCTHRDLRFNDLEYNKKQINSLLQLMFSMLYKPEVLLKMEV